MEKDQDPLPTRGGGRDDCRTVLLGRTKVASFFFIILCALTTGKRLSGSCSFCIETGDRISRSLPTAESRRVAFNRS